MKTLFESTGVYEGMSTYEVASLKRWENEVLPMVLEYQHALMEAAVTKDQVVDMFNRIEKSAKEGGFSGKTTLGKAIEVIKLPSTLLDKMGEVMADTKGVKWSDEKYEQLKGKIRTALGDDNKAVKLVDWYGNFAKTTKGKIAAGSIIGLLTVAATVATGPGGGAIVAAVLRAGNELLKGEKLSTAAGRTIKTAALSFLAGWTAQEFLGLFANTTVDISKLAGYKNIQKVTLFSEVNGRTLFNMDVYMPPSTAQKAMKLFDLAHDAAAAGDVSKATRAFGTLNKVFSDPTWTKVMNAALANNEDLLKTAMVKAEKARQIIADIAGAAEGAVAAGTSGKDEKKTVPESATSVQLTEADIKSILGTIGKWANNATNKVTADKLMKSWEAAGSPLDSEELADFLEKQGLDRKMVYSTLGIPDPSEKKAEPEAEEIKFDTGDADLDAKLTELMKTQGKDAVAKALQAYKTRLTTAADPYEKFKGELRKLAGIPGAKPIPADKATKFKSELAGDLAKMAQGDKDSGAYAANKIMQYAKAGYNVSDQISKWLANAKAGEKGPAPKKTVSGSEKAKNDAYELGKASRGLAEDYGFLSANDYRDITSMLKEHGFDWRDLGIRVILDESVKEGLFISKAAA